MGAAGRGDKHRGGPTLGGRVERLWEFLEHGKVAVDLDEAARLLIALAAFVAAWVVFSYAVGAAFVWAVLRFSA